MQIVYRIRRGNDYLRSFGLRYDGKPRYTWTRNIKFAGVWTNYEESAKLAKIYYGRIESCELRTLKRERRREVVDGVGDSI
jgi:hypothetical protein